MTTTKNPNLVGGHQVERQKAGSGLPYCYFDEGDDTRWVGPSQLTDFKSEHGTRYIIRKIVKFWA